MVEIVTTGGVEKTACRASSKPLYRERDGHFAPVGTINMMVLIHGSLPEGIMARSFITLTEGKSAALSDLGIADVNNGRPATGTGTDGITLVTEIGAERYTDAGPFSELGSFLAKAAYDSVTECLVIYDKRGMLSKSFDAKGGEARQRLIRSRSHWPLLQEMPKSVEKT